MIHVSIIPNVLSLIRMLSVFPWVWCVVRGSYESAFVVLALAAITDALDGWTARRFRWASRLGSVLDPLADKVLCNGVFWTLAWMGWVPWWLAMLLTTRDLVIIGGACLCWSKFGGCDMQPSPWGKGAMALTVVLMWWIMLSTMAGLDWQWLDSALTISMASMVLVSLVNYIITGRRWVSASAQYYPVFRVSECLVLNV